MEARATAVEGVGAVWSLPKRLAFRFGVIAAVLQYFHHLLFLVPGTGELTVAIMMGRHWLVSRFANLVLGIDIGPLEFTGSGDQLFHYVDLLLVLSLALLGAGVWTALERRRAHPRLAAAAIVALRYLLASILMLYGLAKVTPLQFPPLWLGRYDQTIGTMSPMGLLWSFMGHSQAYTWFAGFAEVLGSLLLLWRRTYVIGALVLIAVMTNVVLLNFCYDVPVKLFSLQILLMLIVLVLPQARRLVGGLLGYAMPELPPRTRGTVMAERIRLTLKLTVLVLFALRVYWYHAFSDELERMRAKTPLHGIWRAEHVVIDGVERPPLLTDDARWRKLIFHEWGLTIRYSTDRLRHARVEVDDKAHTVTVLQGVLRQVWHYQRPDPDHLIVDADTIHAELVLEPAPLLATRGFHWINEEPFNR